MYTDSKGEVLALAPGFVGVTMRPKPKVKQIAALQEEIRRLESARPAARDDLLLSAGCAALDRLLPEGGLRRGWLTEWLGVEGGGAGTLALIAAREAARQGGALVVMDRWRRFYPPAAAGLGIDLETTIVIRPPSAKDELWALDQVLRCGGVAAVWAPLENVDDHAFRRLQLAAEAGGVLGLLVRPANVRGKPSWSDVQLWVEPQVGGRLAAERSDAPGKKEKPKAESRKPKSTLVGFPLSAFRFSSHSALRTPHSAFPFRRFRMEVTRCCGGTAGGSVEVEFDPTTGVLRGADSYEETHSVPVAPALADSAAPRRSTIA
jgi:protein ImuA